MSDEGLESEVLDELDVDEVPTAAYETIFPENIGGWSAHKTEYLADKAIDNAETEAVKNELVTREKMEEALGEAVQQARERERRCILENLQTKLYQLDWIQILQEAIESRPSSWGYPDRNVETENGFDHPVIEWRNASDEFISPIWNQLEEELEEEVEKNTSTRPKTGKSDNFGETEDE